MAHSEQQRNATRCRLRLHKNHMAIVRNVIASDISERLFARGVITMAQDQDTRNESVTETSRMATLYETVYRTPDANMETAFEAFLSALEVDGSTDWLAEQIRRTDVESDLQQYEQHLTRTEASAGPSSNHLDVTDSVRTRRPSLRVVAQNEMEDENDPENVVYSSGILAFEYMRGSFRQAPPRSASRSLQPADQPGPSNRDPAPRRPPRSDSDASNLDADRELANLTFGQMVNGMDNNMQTQMGIGERRTALNIRDTASGLRDLAKMFEHDHRHEIDSLVDSAVNDRMHDNPNWFSDLAAMVLRDSPSWGRIISLFVFASRFLIRTVREAISRGARGAQTLVREFGRAVFGFTSLIRNRLASWIGSSGGWAVLMQQERVEQIRSQIAEMRDWFLTPEILTRTTFAVLAISIGMVSYWWYRGAY